MLRVKESKIVRISIVVLAIYSVFCFPQSNSLMSILFTGLEGRHVIKEIIFMKKDTTKQEECYENYLNLLSSIDLHKNKSMHMEVPESKYLRKIRYIDSIPVVSGSKIKEDTLNKKINKNRKDTKKEIYSDYCFSDVNDITYLLNTLSKEDEDIQIEWIENIRTGSVNNKEINLSNKTLKKVIVYMQKTIKESLEEFKQNTKEKYQMIDKYTRKITEVLQPWNTYILENIIESSKEKPSKRYFVQNLVPQMIILELLTEMNMDLKSYLIMTMENELCLENGLLREHTKLLPALLMSYTPRHTKYILDYLKHYYKDSNSYVEYCNQILNLSEMIMYYQTAVKNTNENISVTRQISGTSRKEKITQVIKQTTEKFSVVDNIKERVKTNDNSLKFTQMHFGSLFTTRNLVNLNTPNDLVFLNTERVTRDIVNSKLSMIGSISEYYQNRLDYGLYRHRDLIRPEQREEIDNLIKSILITQTQRNMVAIKNKDNSPLFVSPVLVSFDVKNQIVPQDCSTPQCMHRKLHLQVNTVHQGLSPVESVIAEIDISPANSTGYNFMDIVSHSYDASTKNIDSHMLTNILTKKSIPELGCYIVLKEVLEDLKDTTDFIKSVFDELIDQNKPTEKQADKNNANLDIYTIGVIEFLNDIDTNDHEKKKMISIARKIYSSDITLQEFLGEIVAMVGTIENRQSLFDLHRNGISLRSTISVAKILNAIGTMNILGYDSEEMHITLRQPVRDLIMKEPECWFSILDAMIVVVSDICKEEYFDRVYYNRLVADTEHVITPVDSRMKRFLSDHQSVYNPSNLFEMTHSLLGIKPAANRQSGQRKILENHSYGYKLLIQNISPWRHIDNIRIYFNLETLRLVTNEDRLLCTHGIIEDIFKKTFYNNHKGEMNNQQNNHFYPSTLLNPYLGVFYGVPNNMVKVLFDKVLRDVLEVNCMVFPTG
ncbi:hypothetical protein NEOKW01_1246 [Nematocida sp. AWRm80]|nr:hypothetical protein NEOKW01_1246 [Nematocida sp. AWRm80]